MTKSKDNIGPIMKRLGVFTSSMSRSQRIASVAVILAVFGIWIDAISHRYDFAFSIGLAELEIYWLPAPHWLALLSWVGLGVLVLRFLVATSQAALDSTNDPHLASA